MAEIKKDKDIPQRPEDYNSLNAFAGESIQRLAGESDDDYSFRRSRILADKILGEDGQLHYEYTDGFPKINVDKIPKGFRYEFKRYLSVNVQGEQETSYLYSLSRQGWQIVPASRHPEAGMRPGEDYITYGSTILMEISEILANMVLDKFRRETNANQSEAQLSRQFDNYRDQYHVGHNHAGAKNADKHSDGIGIHKKYAPADG